MLFILAFQQGSELLASGAFLLPAFAIFFKLKIPSKNPHHHTVTFRIATKCKHLKIQN